MSARLAFVPELRDVAIRTTNSGTLRVVPLYALLDNASAGRMLSGHLCRRDGCCLAVVIERRNP